MRSAFDNQHLHMIFQSSDSRISKMTEISFLFEYTAILKMKTVNLFARCSFWWSILKTSPAFEIEWLKTLNKSNCVFRFTFVAVSWMPPISFLFGMKWFCSEFSNNSSSNNPFCWSLNSFLNFHCFFKICEIRSSFCSDVFCLLSVNLICFFCFFSVLCFSFFCNLIWFLLCLFVCFFLVL